MSRMERAERAALYIFLAGVGVAIIAAAGALAIPELRKIVWQSVALLGVILTVSSALFLIYEYRDLVGTKRMIPFIGMLLSGLCFVGFTTWYFWPHSKVEIPSQSLSSQLEDLYSKEFADLGSFERGLSVAIKNPANGLDMAIPVGFRVCPDFRSNSDFVSLYVPFFSDGRLAQRPEDFFEYLKTQIKPTREKMKEELGIGLQTPGSPMKNWRDLVFSGQVYIYTPSSLDSLQMAN
jgi:hypothetical protein